MDLREDIIREQALALSEVLLPWREKYPDVEVAEVTRLGSAAGLLVDASRDASLVTGPRSWVPWPVEVFVRIEPELVTGRELVGGRTLYGVNLPS